MPYDRRAERVPVKLRLLRRIRVEPSGCWVWLGAKGSSGYGHMTITDARGRRTIMAHRVSYETFRGPIPAGAEIDHRCRVRVCLNPEHLEVVDRYENVRRQPQHAERSSKPTCKHGHPLDGVRTRAGGGRYCRTCVKLNKRRQRSTGGIP